MSEIFPASTVRENLNAYLHELFGSYGVDAHGRQTPATVPTGRKILELEADQRIEYVMESLSYGQDFLREIGWPPDNLRSIRVILAELRDALLRKALPFNADQIARLAAFMADDPNHYYGPNKGILSALERFAAEGALPESAVSALTSLLNGYQLEHLNSEAEKGV